ncbi:hypothetical protein [Vibrio aestuarianus]|uniref:Uncharacterized protein n=1 Tax=Vibrio aestuarianus TaxID=28171 RepID=A0ABD7YQP9_9VIBR|nr:hypothetical protein [Vibrio aestuarianus]WGK87228.1 hypothetical protein PYE67_13980 [Vibrio aestuarianus]CAH8235519.1 conserved hypothetical protein [Vibrio aestuarianus]
MSTLILRDNREAFIDKHIRQILEAEGYEPLEINRACDLAVQTFRTTASFGGAKGGKCFDYCLAKAKQLLGPVKKKAAKNANAKAKGKAA